MDIDTPHSTGRYNGYATVNDPLEYLNAPAMIMTDSAASPPPPGPPPALPLILQAAVDYAKDFRIQTAEDLQAFYSEQANLERSMMDIGNRLDVEFKMREAAASIGKLQDDRASLYSTKTSNRLSRMLGQDKEAKKERRLSEQAAEEVAMSNEKISSLESRRALMERRKTTVDKLILQHHCAVMAKAVAGKPLPNHRREASQGPRRSWIMAPPSAPSAVSVPAALSPRQRHQRQFSAASNDAESLATVTEFPSRTTTPTTTTPRTTTRASSVVDEELDELTAKILRALPDQSPALNGKVSYIASAFDRLSRELAETRNHLEASQTQVSHCEARIQYLQNAVDQRKSGSGSAETAALIAMKREAADEREKATKWRDQAESQRAQLQSTTKSLEEVTRLAIQLEGDRMQVDELVPKLNDKIASLEEDKVALLKQRLSATSNTSRLCEEFHHIVAELVAKHRAEVSALCPAALPRRDTAALDALRMSLSQPSTPSILVPPRTPQYRGEYRPQYDRRNTEVSETLSKSSSVYADSANPSVASVADDGLL